MNTKITKTCCKEEKYVSAGLETFTERLKKARALNCNPSDIGMDNLIWKRIFFSRTGIMTKIL